MDPPHKGAEVSKRSLVHNELYYLDVRDRYPLMDLPIFLVTFLYYDRSPGKNINDTAIFEFVNNVDSQYNVPHSIIIGPMSIVIGIDDPNAKVYAYKQSLPSLLTKQGHKNLLNIVPINTKVENRITKTISNAAMNRRRHALAMLPRVNPVANNKGGKRIQRTRRARRSRK